MKPRVLITRPVRQQAVDEVQKRREVPLSPVDGPMPLERLAQEMTGLDPLMPCGQLVSSDAIADASKRCVVANIAAGYDNIDLDVCNLRRIVVKNTPDVLSEAAADVAFAVLISTARRVLEGDCYVRQGNWPYWQWSFLWGSDLHGKTLGLYGCGRIGQAMARRGRGFSMRILYHARQRIPANRENELQAQLGDKQTA